MCKLLLLFIVTPCLTLNKVLGLPIFATAILLMVIPLSPLPIANAAKITVPTDFPTIQDAIDAASDGDTINVLAGTYTQQLTINKDLKIIGAGAKSTIINAPTLLDTNVNGNPYIVEVNNGAKVSIKGFTIEGPSGTDCAGLVGVSVVGGATLNLDSSDIKGCTENGALIIGGHAIIVKVHVTGYRDHGLFALESDSSLKVTRSTIVGVSEDSVGQLGILVVFAKGTILNNKITGNICTNPACGPDFFTQTQGTGIFFFEAATGSVISNNDVSNNDLGIAVAHNSGCCKIDHNKLKDNTFFGMTLIDGEHKSAHDKISGGNIGVAAVAIDVDTTATLVHDKITYTEIPTQELECCGFTAEIVTIPPNSFQSSQLQSTQASEVGPDFLKKKFGVEEDTSVSTSAASPF